jgi:hypothetical protein
MSFSVGILYSAQEFTSYVSNNELAVDEFQSAFDKFSLATPKDILEVTKKCYWVDFLSDGSCKLTEKGEKLLGADSAKALRLQICDLIDAYQPPWAAKIPNGRQEAAKFFPDEVHQCFKEAGLLDGWDEEIVEWWDRLSIAFRSHKSVSNLITGRRAEKLSIEHETKRLGFPPHWQSMESNFSGYDILSKSDERSLLNRMIEVKGSTLPKKEAFCFVTRNEWNTAKLSKDYRFHLWCLKGEPILIEVETEDMEVHIPHDNGSGIWETTKVWFKDFKV